MDNMMIRHGIGLAKPFPRDGDTIPPPDWADERVAGLQMLTVRVSANEIHTLYRFTIAHEDDSDRSIASDTVMPLDEMR